MNLDVNILELLNLETKQQLALNEINFQKGLLRMINNSNPDRLDEFQSELRQHVAGNYPNMIEIIDKNLDNPNQGFNPNPENQQIFTEDQLDGYYVDDHRVLNAQPNQEQLREAQPPKRESQAERDQARNGQKRERRRNRTKDQEARRKYKRNEEFTKIASKKLGKDKNFIVGESFDNEKLTLLRKENNDLNQSIAQLELERQKIDEKIKRQSQITQARARKTTTDMTFLRDFDIKNFSNPSNMDLLRILNEKEIALNRLEKSINILERSYNEMAENEDNETSISNIHFNFEQNMPTTHSLSKSYAQLNIMDLRNSEFKKKTQNEPRRDSFIGEIRADISRILNKRRDQLIE